MMKSVAESLAILDKFLNQLERPAALLLKAGASPHRTASALSKRGLQASSELIKMYEWHDGTSAYTGAELDDIHLIPGFYFLELEDATASYDAFASSGRWNADWFPVLANGGGDFYAVDCSSQESRVGAIHHFRIDETVHPMEYQSVRAMLATFAEAYVRGIFYLDPAGYLEMNDEAFASLAASTNPGVPWWTS